MGIENETVDGEEHEDAHLNQTSGLSTSRIEALSDGIFAIAMTLLVLDLKIPLGLQADQMIGSLYNT